MANEEQQYPDNGTYLFWITEMLQDILGRILPLEDAYFVCPTHAVRTHKFLFNGAVRSTEYSTSTNSLIIQRGATLFTHTHLHSAKLKRA